MSQWKSCQTSTIYTLLFDWYSIYFYLRLITTNILLSFSAGYSLKILNTNHRFSFPIVVHISQSTLNIKILTMRGPCVVFNCKNRGVHLFPKNDILKLKWIKAMRLETYSKPGWREHKYSYVCSNHFQQNDFLPSSTSGAEKISKRLKKNAVPLIFPWNYCTTNEPCASTSTAEHYPINFDPQLASMTYSRQVLPTHFAEEIMYTSEPNISEDPLNLGEQNEESEIPETLLDGNEVAVNIKLETLSPPVTTVSTLAEKCNTSVQTDDTFRTVFSLHGYKNNDKAIHFFTGLESFVKMQLVFNSLGNCDNLNYFYGDPPNKLDTLEQFFITVMILRRHKAFEEISMMYLIPIKQVSNIFITWIRFMSLQWRQLDLWLNREMVTTYMPLDFYDKYPQTRTVLDATECPIKKPGLPSAQQVTFSSYKNRNTVKALIGITPSGLISYLSPCYGGSATDRQIIERSTILQRFDFRDEIMVDKGLNVQDIFAPYGVKVNMPTFFKKGNQISPDTLKADRKIASKRVHVERVIGMLKTYRILTQPMNLTETILSSDILLICAMFVNFRSNIINKNA